MGTGGLSVTLRGWDTRVPTAVQPGLGSVPLSLTQLL